MSWMTAPATLKMTETELTRRHSVRTVTHINMVWCGAAFLLLGGAAFSSPPSFQGQGQGQGRRR